MEEMTGIGSAMAGYLAGLEPKTSKAYSSHLRKWARWCGENGVDLLEPGRFAIEAYGRYIRDVLGGTKRTAYGSMSVVRGFYRYAYEEGACARDWGANVRMPKLVSKSEGTWLDRRQAAAFLREASGRCPRDAALCRLLLLCGPRVSEAIMLDVGDFDPLRPSVRYRRKGEWMNTVSVPRSVADSLAEAIGGRPDGPIFSNGTRRMSYYLANSVVASVAEASGASGITPHSLRRTFCTLAREAGVPDRDIMASGGWSDVKMLDYYDMGSRGERADVGAAVEEFIEGCEAVES